MAYIGENMRKLNKKTTCRIIVEDGMQLLVMPDGTRIPKQVWTRVTDPLNDACYCIVKVLVNLDDTNDECIHSYSFINSEGSTICSSCGIALT